jgi:hypothetical protein
MKQEGFQGWFSSIEGRTAIEVALINDPTIFEAISSEPMVYDWNHGTPSNNYNKYWGTQYPVTERPLEFRVHSRYKEMIEEYMRQGEQDPDFHALQILFKKAKIEYHDGPVPSADTVAWVCPPN